MDQRNRRTDDGDMSLMPASIIKRYLHMATRPRPRSGLLAKGSTQAALSPVFAAILSSTAVAGDTCASSSGSSATIRPTQAPNAVAEVHFRNTLADVANEDLACVLSLDGLDVDAHLRLGRGGAPDTLVATPPEGFIAIPWELTIPDGSDGLVLIYPEGKLVGF